MGRRRLPSVVKQAGFYWHLPTLVLGLPPTQKDPVGVGDAWVDEEVPGSSVGTLGHETASRGNNSGGGARSVGADYSPLPSEALLQLEDVSRVESAFV